MKIQRNGQKIKERERKYREIERYKDINISNWRRKISAQNIPSFLKALCS